METETISDLSRECMVETASTKVKMERNNGTPRA